MYFSLLFFVPKSHVLRFAINSKYTRITHHLSGSGETSRSKEKDENGTHDRYGISWDECDSSNDHGVADGSKSRKQPTHENNSPSSNRNGIDGDVDAAVRHMLSQKSINFRLFARLPISIYSLLLNEYLFIYFCSDSDSFPRRPSKYLSNGKLFVPIVCASQTHVCSVLSLRHLECSTHESTTWFSGTT